MNRLFTHSAHRKSFSESYRKRHEMSSSQSPAVPCSAERWLDSAPSGRYLLAHMVSRARRTRYARPEIYDFFCLLRRKLGPQDWWPAETPFEVIVGAILTQNTNWQNVARAIHNLRGAGRLRLRALARTPTRKVAALVRPSGYFNQKASRLKEFVRFVANDYAGSLQRMFREPTSKLRARLLALRGIGAETADSILLYAGNHRSFVVDAYTRRILARHDLISEKASYSDIQALFEKNLPRSLRIYNEYHALLVEVGKRYCRRREALCAACPLGTFLTDHQRWQVQKNLARVPS